MGQVYQPILRILGYREIKDKSLNGFRLFWPQDTKWIGGILVESVRGTRGTLQESNTAMVTFWTNTATMGRERMDLILELISRQNMQSLETNNCRRWMRKQSWGWTSGIWLSHGWLVETLTALGDARGGEEGLDEASCGMLSFGWCGIVKLKKVPEHLVFKSETERRP